ncbi:MAG TPA: hypothetical protein VM760_08860 [Sphingomicrobium sp.]|jgi:hypothetical protein|nr:hypothetical protein [Sphingomicrobium sp.]
MMLGEFIRAAAAMRFSWECFGCAALPAQWVERVTGKDPFAGMPECRTEAEVNEAVASSGGMLALWDRQLAGIARRTIPQVGAVGLAQLPDGMQMAGIVSDTRWVFLTEQGIRAMPIQPQRVIATWCIRG